MTISPVSAPSVAPAGGASASGTGLPGEFAALVQRHLDDAAGEESAMSGEQAAALLQAASTNPSVVSDGLAAMLAGLLGASAAAAAGTAGDGDVLGGAAPNPASGAAATPLGGPLAGLGMVSGSAASLADQAVSAGLLTGAGELRAPGTPGAAVAEASQVDVLQNGVSQAGVRPPGAEGTVDPTLLEGMQVTAASTASVDGAHTTTGNGASAVGSVAAAAAAAGSAGADASSDAAPRAGAVTDQVFPQVARLVSRGDGMHRLTLRLHPADLGEVKVVLTVRDNVVDVTLSAGAAAREALRDGSPQLRALLELAGATTGQLVVRELSTTGATLAHQTSTGQQGATTGQQPGETGSDAAGDSAAGDEQTDDPGGGATRGRGDSAAGSHDPTLDPLPTGRTSRHPSSQLDLDL
jgi:flagellar hook-length control protein FliK